MKKFMEILSVILAAVGAILVYAGCSTSDYYVIELGMPEPAYVWPMIIVGIVCMVPAIACIFFERKQMTHGSRENI